MKKRSIFFFALILSCFALQAGVKLPNVLTSNMVLQRDQPVPIWGTSLPGESVTVTFAGQSKNALAAGDGRWQVSLDPMSASFEPSDLRISASKTRGVQPIKMQKCRSVSIFEIRIFIIQTEGCLGILKKWRKPYLFS